MHSLQLTVYSWQLAFNRLPFAVCRLSLLILLTLLVSTAHAQRVPRYLVLLKDKTGTPFSIDKPEAFLSKKAIERRQRQNIKITTRDLPVNPTYVNQIRQTGATVWYTSRWLNAVLVQANATQLTAIRALSFVAGLEFNRPLSNFRVSAENADQSTQQKLGTEGTEAFNYGTSLNQNQMLGVDKMHDAGYNGRGLSIAILDAGFRNSNTNRALTSLFSDNRLLTTYDFVQKNTDVFEDDTHGNNVFSIMASFQEGGIIGPAYGASYMLLRTEDAATETRLEEANWLVAAEFADSSGVDIIQSSLGYTTFDTPADNYTYANMNGRTALITRAADWAAAVGIVVVVSAGNDGASSWRYIAAPADADSVLAVAAVNSTRGIATFSSIGPSADGRVKPDVSAQGVATVLANSSGTVTTGNGTSYAAPLIAGLVAAFWQAHPYLTAMQVIDCIRKAGDRYANPTVQFGYGIPTFERAVEVARRDYPVTAIASWQRDVEAYASPNPAGIGTTLKVSLGTKIFDNESNIQFIDAAGRSVFEQAVQIGSQNQLELALPQQLKSGTYFLRLSDKRQQQVLKIIVQ
ncbi:MAG: S8 family peptidase [Spirosomaceae bacterium]|jgi:subtilisin family serine protease|nr:S8 family peptidase [Spirosomataceae bacterium]